MTPAPSRLLLTFIVVVHLSAIAALFIVPGLALFWRAVLIGVVIASAIYSVMLHSHVWTAKTVQTLFWREFGGWELLNAKGQHLPVILLDSSFSSLHLSVLNFKTRTALGNQRYTVILLADNCPPETRRYLRMRMKLYIANRVRQ